MFEGATLSARISDHSELPAIVEPHSGASLSYAEMTRIVDGLARTLVARGVMPDQRVALLAANGPEAIIAFLAIARAGCAAVPLNPDLTANEISALFGQLSPGMLLFDSDLAPSSLEAICTQHRVEVLELDRAPHRWLTRAGPTGGELPDPHPDTVCLLLQTSGTTSRPKTVPLRHRNLVSSAANIARGYQLTAEDTTYCVMPLFHIHGLVGSALSTLVSGGTVVIPRRVSLSRFAADLSELGATWVSAVPTILARVTSAAAQGEGQRRQLRFGRTSSSALPPELAARFEEFFEAPVLEAYGMTEASHQMTSNPLPPGERRVGSVGVATGTELAVVDEHWTPLGAEASGEVIVRGPGVVDGYLDNPDVNAASFRDGWFRTGDVGTLSSDGYLTLVGRLKELINRGGEKIAPREIDEALLNHPAISEAVAFGVPDAKYGEVVHAAVVADWPVPERELMAHCREQIAAFKVPSRITFLSEIPKGPTGKVQRTALASQLQQ